MNRKVVGILGGMGPEATILLQQRVLAKIQARDDSDHLPLLIDMNPQVPSRIAHLLEGGDVDPGPYLADMARNLQDAGATALGMPCNTAHHYATAIEGATSIPLLNMVKTAVEEAAKRVPKSAALGILGSPAVRDTGVFSPDIQRLGLTELWPDRADDLLVAIRQIKAHGPTSISRKILTDCAQNLIDKGASLLIIACSEFSLMAQDVCPIGATLDTVDVLVDAIYQHTKSPIFAAPTSGQIG